tara:strand:- start:1233 stop:1733 length:501 start_codon:yes stop_codon:yes gene_type:complete
MIKNMLILIISFLFVNSIILSSTNAQGICDGAGGGLLCGAGIGGGIGAAIDGEDGAAAGAIIGGIMGIASSLNDNNQTENQELKQVEIIDPYQIISTDYSVELIYNTQIALISLGYNVGFYDGRFTMATKNAIKSYQKNNSLIGNGIPSDELYAHIRKNVAIIYAE